MKSLFRVALVEPEIPQNTGNIGRTCVGTCSELHLVKPYGFEINDKNLKRAGLDYWPHLQWKEHASIPEWEKEIVDPKRVFYFSAKATRPYYDVQFEPGDWLVFGKETAGLPDSLLSRDESRNLIIPLLGPVRGLNVATAVAIALYESVRQIKLTHPHLYQERLHDPMT